MLQCPGPPQQDLREQTPTCAGLAAGPLPWRYILVEAPRQNAKTITNLLYPSFRVRLSLVLKGIKMLNKI